MAVHGTGTPLGDPIEMNALGQALSHAGTGCQHHVTIGSVKSCYGHTEGAAGLTGTLLALQSLLNKAGAPILHLRNMNPYVESTFADLKSFHQLIPAIPRASAPLLGALGEQLSGTSSFGMSGVNAHALFEAVDAADSAIPAQPQALQRERHWALAPVFYIGDLASPAPRDSSRCSIMTELTKPGLAFLWDHQVRVKNNFNPPCFSGSDQSLCVWQVNGKVIVPGAAMFEALAAASSILLGAPHNGTSLLRDVSIAEALVMPMKAGLVVDVAAGSRDGTLELTSFSQRPALRKTHCAGRLQRAFEPASTPPAGPFLRTAVRSGLAWADTSMAPPLPSATGEIWSSKGSEHGFNVHPAILDNVLHLSAAFIAPQGRVPLKVPVGLSAFVLRANNEYSVWTHPSATPSAEVPTIDYQLHPNAASQPVFKLDKLEIRELKWTPPPAPVADPGSQEFLYRTEWQMQQCSAASTDALVLPSKPAPIFFAAGELPTATYDAAAYGSSQSPAVSSTADILALLQSALPNVSKLSLALRAPDFGGNLLVGPQLHRCMATGCTSAVAALFKAASVENPGIGMSSAFATHSAAAETTSGDAFGTAHISRTTLRAKLFRQPIHVQNSNCHLMPMPRGSLANLRHVPHTQATPGRGEVKIAVQAVGLNFRDVLNVLGMYPGDPGPPGGDCAGVITEVGAGVSKLQPGRSARALC